VDANGTALLFDFKDFSSPWIKAMKCRAQQILKKPFDIKIGFKNALGPVFVGTLKEIGSSLETAGDQRTEYGRQRNTQNNDTMISEAPENIKTILQ
jgi:hypothetical protein